MRKFIIRVVIFVLPVVIISYPIDVFLSANLYRTGTIYGDVPTMKQIYEGTINAEILIIGSSRAEMHFDPRIMEMRSGKTTFNLGESLVDWNLIQYRLETYLKYNQAPEYLVANVDAAMFKFVESNYLVRPHYLPYMLFNREFLKIYDVPFENYMFPLVRYIGHRKLFFDVIKLWARDSVIPPDNIKGYSPVDQPFDDRHLARFKEKDYSNLDIPPDQFYQFLEDRLPKTTIIGVHTPILIDSLKDMNLNQLRTDRFKVEFEKRGWTFLDYSFSPISKDIKYFYNSTHMNAIGAQLFTKTLMKDLDSLGVLPRLHTAESAD